MDENNLNVIDKMRSLRSRMIVIYTVLAVILYFSTSAFLIYRYNKSLKSQARDFSKLMSLQLQKSIASYLHEVEHMGMAVFEDKDSISYYPSEGGKNSYDDIQKRQDITDKLISLSLMENYCDFGIIYRGRATAGKISDGTLDAFGSGIFEELYSIVQKDGEAWITDYINKSNRIYYTKIINDNAVLLVSVYATELDTVFQNIGDSSEARIYLTDRNGQILYACENTEEHIGEKLDNKASEIFSGSTNVSVISNDYIGSVLQTENDWNVYCFISEKAVLVPVAKIKTWLFSIGLGILFVFISIGFLISSKYTAYGEGRLRMLRDTDYMDKLTGLFNGMGVEEEISDRIETCLMGSTYAFILVKIKDFDDIRIRLGSNYTDDSLKKLGDMISASFSSKDIIGINENSEFVIFADFSDFDLFKAHNTLKERCKVLCSLFKDFYAGDENEHKLYMAMGVCVYPDNGKTFDELYDNAAKALEISVKAEKDSCVFFDTLKNKRE